MIKKFWRENKELIVFMSDWILVGVFLTAVVVMTLLVLKNHEIMTRAMTLCSCGNKTLISTANNSYYNGIFNLT